jgi:hypothetical protein
MPGGCIHSRPEKWTLESRHQCIRCGASKLNNIPSIVNLPDDHVNRYIFPEKPFLYGELIDLTADEKPFYLNPYSGEMSLEFPKAERTCRGGILAYV